MKLSYTNRALKDLRNIEKKVQNRILDALYACADDPFTVVLKKLRSCDNEYLIRVGDYRIRIEISWEQDTIIVRRICHRKEIYRD